MRRAIFYVAAGLFCLCYGMAFGLLGQFAPLLFIVPIALLALLIIWALPDSTRAPTALMEKIFFVALVAWYVWPAYLAIAVPGLPWITLSRLLDSPVALLLLISVSVSKGFRSRMASILRPTPEVVYPLVAFFVLDALSIVFSSNKGESIQKSINDQIAYTTMFFACAFIMYTPGKARAFAWTLWGTALTLTVMGLWEGKVQHVLWANHIPSFLRIQAQSVDIALSGLQRMYGGGYRVQVTIGPIGMGEFIGIVMPFAIHLAVVEKVWLRKAALFGSLPFFMLVVMETQSRSGFITVAMSAPLYVLYWAFTHWRRGGGKTSLMGLSVLTAYPVGFLGLIGSALFVGRVRRHILGSGGIVAASNQARVDQWRMAIPKILHQPWGYGVGQSGRVVGYTEPSGLLTLDTFQITLLVDVGVIGFLAFFGAFVMGIFRAARDTLKLTWFDAEVALIAPACISLVNFVSTKSVFSETVNNPLGFMVLGVVVALSARIRAPLPEPDVLPALSTQRAQPPIRPYASRT